MILTLQKINELHKNLSNISEFVHDVDRQVGSNVGRGSELTRMDIRKIRQVLDEMMQIEVIIH